MATEEKEKKLFLGKFELTQKQRSWIYTGMFITAALIFFIVNNTNGEEGEGPYPPDYNPSYAKGNFSAPDFTLSTVDGEKISLSDYRGKVVILNFFATWSKESQRGIPELISMQYDYSDKDIAVIGMSLDALNDQEGAEEKLKNYKVQMGINYPLVLANSDMIHKYGDLKQLPVYFIIDTQGNIRKKYTMPVPRSYYKAHIENLLNE